MCSNVLYYTLICIIGSLKHFILFIGYNSRNVAGWSTLIVGSISSTLSSKGPQTFSLRSVNNFVEETISQCVAAVAMYFWTTCVLKYRLILGKCCVKSYSWVLTVSVWNGGCAFCIHFIYFQFWIINSFNLILEKIRIWIWGEFSF